MSKKDDSPAISLFSFQDIITSITGIMFLVVLLLILLIFESTPAENRPSGEDRKDIRELRQQIIRLQQMLIQDRRREDDLKKRIAEQQKLPMAVLEKKKIELETHFSQLRQQQKQLNDELFRLQNMEKATADMIAQLRQKQQTVTGELDEAKLKQLQLKKVVEKLQKDLQIAKQTVKFSVESAADKRHLLAELGNDGFQVLDFSDKRTYDLRKPGASGDEKRQAFLDWVKTRDRYSEVVSVILSPGNLKEWIPLSTQLRKLHFSHGLELYPVDDMSIFSGEGAETK